MKSAFSIIELILIVSLFSIVSVGYLGFSSKAIDKNEFENTKNSLVTALSEAQLNSMAGKSSSQWGVDTTTAGVIRVYASASTAFDKTYTYSSDITITPTFNIVFDKLTGNLSSAQSVTISDNVGNSVSFTVNTLGVIEFN